MGAAVELAEEAPIAAADQAAVRPQAAGMEDEARVSRPTTRLLGATDPQVLPQTRLERAGVPPVEVTGAYGAVRLLSLDVALGALAGGSMVSAFLGRPMPWAWYVILPVSVWVIYTWDHLLDARRLGDRASTPRHRFHHRRFVPLSLATVVGALLAVTAAFHYLGPTGVLFGLGMGSIATGHFVLVRLVGGRTSPLLIKEFGVAVVYCLGIWGLPWIESERPTDPWVWIGFGQFFLLALINLLAFSLFEREIDERDGQSSFVRALGRKQSVRVIHAIFLAFVLLGTLGITRYGTDPILRMEITLLPMAGILAILLWRPDTFSRGERYRAWGDGAFLLPFLYRLLP